MVPRICGWFALASVITIALLGFALYLTILMFIISFIVGMFTILYLNYDSKNIFPVDIDCLDDPLQPINFTVQSSKVLDLFESKEPLPKFDNRITGSETVDSFLNEIIVIIINDYVNPWYEIITDDVELPTHSIKRLVLTAGANVANRVKSVDWIHLLSTRFPEELTTHLKLFKQSRVLLLTEISEAVLYLIAPEEAWKCHALKIILIDLVSAVVLRPLIDLLSDPDNINRTIIKTCCRDSCLSSELFLLVIRCCGDAEELDATLELVQKDIQKLHSRDSAGEWDLQDRQKLSSLQYLSRIIQAKRATLGPQEGATTSSTTEKVSEEVMRSLKFIRATAAWKSNAQYLLEIELNETDAPHTSKAVLDNLRSSALELCDLYLGPNRPPVMGVPENCHSDLVRKITTEGEEFTKNPVTCFDDVQKCVCDALEDDPSWQSDFMMDNETDGLERKNSDVHKRDYKTDTKKYAADGIPLSSSRHNRSRSDVVGNLAQRMINESSGPSSLSSSYSNTLSLSHSEITQRAKNMYSPLSAYIIETALVQDKGRTFGIYAIAVTRISDNEVWHIYRRYSDFYDLHTSIKEKWPELGNLSFPAKKTFQNTSRSVLESRKRMLNNYLQSLTSIAMDARYMALLSQDYLGGFLSPEIQTERHGNTFDGLFVNSIRAGMRTLKNMPDQFVNTVDGVMDGISKVFQGKSGENYDAVKSGNSSDGQDDGDESVALRLLEEVLGIRGLWLRRRLLAPVRTLIADRVNKKVLELVSSLTSPRNVVHYLKTFKQWLTSRNNSKYNARDSATKARTRVAAKVALLSAASDDLRHIVGSDAARRGLLSVFDMLQTEEINRRLIYVLLEATLINLFPDNNFQDLFKKLYSNSVRVVPSKKSVNL
ncbi:Sorting nexin-13 [Papilio machaon]|uniref:Sorting nexin-13 n=1 Tax=Papilio machaon TaxID=76193 RepID=A0A194QSA1_PAPMA|nr:Sorting nexin-13 [Papilio machaon]